MSALRRIALVVLALAAAGAALASTAAGQQASYPACAPGTPPLPQPTVSVVGSSATPGRVVAGRPFEISYDEPPGVIVHDTLAHTAGTTFHEPPTSSSVATTVGIAGPAAFTVRYYDSDAPLAARCTQSLTFTVAVEAGDLITARIGYAQGTTVRFIAGFKRLPRRGVLLIGGGPITGVLFPCTDTTALLPVVAELRVERALRRKPSTGSPLTTLTIPDPCGPKRTTVAGLGVRLRHTGVFDEYWTVAVEHRFTGGARYWLRITQAGRLVGQLRYYTAHRPAARRFAETWVIAPEAAFERARCKRPPRGSDSAPLGFRKFPIPPCPR
jgi:hypothetical protein